MELELGLDYTLLATIQSESPWLVEVSRKRLTRETLELELDLDCALLATIQVKVLGKWKSPEMTDHQETGTGLRTIREGPGRKVLIGWKLAD